LQLVNGPDEGKTVFMQPAIRLAGQLIHGDASLLPHRGTTSRLSSRIFPFSLFRGGYRHAYPYSEARDFSIASSDG